MMQTNIPSPPLVATAQIVTKYVAANEVPATRLPELIREVYSSLSGGPVPIVPIENSVEDDCIICLEDGKRLKVLTRHLMTAYGMTPDDYRARWKLPGNYPMVAPSYARHRSLLAQARGLGRRANGEETVEPRDGGAAAEIEARKAA